MFNNEVLFSLSELEHSIYDCVAKNKDRLPHMTIKELADEAHVSTGSVLRFCKKLGCDGYSHFKLRYREYLQPEQFFFEDTGETALKNFLFYIDSKEFQDSIEAAFQLLKRSRQIIFFGVGSSGTLGRYGARFFSNIGRFSLWVEDPWQPVLQDLREDTVAIALSVSGSTSQTIDIAHQLKERGSKLIAITNGAGSMLARIADLCISYHVPEVTSSKGNITTQVPVVYILETLAKKLYTYSSDIET